MSINSALFAGTSGLLANSGALASISDNIANVNTTAYKRAITSFVPLIEDDLSTIVYSAGGVRSNTRQLVQQQGIIASANTATDLAINGSGFFLVTNDTNVTSQTDYFLTRAGSFAPDQDGFLRNTAGLYMQGWPADENGDIRTDPSDATLLETININAIGGAAEATSKLQFNANLDSATPGDAAIDASYTIGSMSQFLRTAAGTNPPAGAVEPHFSSDVQVFDSLGNLRNVTLAFRKLAVNSPADPGADVAPNNWRLEVFANPPSQIDNDGTVPGSAAGDGVLFTGQLAFRTDGQLDIANSQFSNTDADGFPQIVIDASDAVAATGPQWDYSAGAARSVIDLGFFGSNSAGGLTQLRAESSVSSTSVNGSRFGTITGVEVDQQGFMKAKFNNGIIKTIYQIPLATVPNPNGLSAEPGGAYSISLDSGEFTLKQPGIAGSGLISPQSLEASTVDLATEFTGLITTQRAYSAASKIITTADEMLEELIRMKR
jgi:flagellar hook protein FlgE